MDLNQAVQSLRAAITLPGRGVLWLVFGGVLLLYSIISLMLEYHWRSYAFDEKVMKLTTRLYFVISGILVAGMFAFLLFY